MVAGASFVERKSIENLVMIVRKGAGLTMNEAPQHQRSCPDRPQRLGKEPNHVHWNGWSQRRDLVMIARKAAGSVVLA